MNFQMKGPAYSATIRTTYEQRLADGNVIHASGEVKRARDSNGRTMQTDVRSCEYSAEGLAGERTMVVVTDPKAGTVLSWVEGPRSTHIAYLRHTPERKSEIVHVRPPTLETFAKRTDSRNEQTTEQLGTRTIAGTEATGTRWTRIIPSGAEGNDLPLKVVRETWSSRTLNTALLSIYDDPREGRHVTEVTAFTLGEPDPSVFAPPMGYTVDEGKPIETRVATGTSTGGAITAVASPSSPR